MTGNESAFCLLYDALLNSLYCLLYISTPLAFIHVNVDTCRLARVIAVSRRSSAETIHRLSECMLYALLAVVCFCNGVVEQRQSLPAAFEWTFGMVFGMETRKICSCFPGPGGACFFISEDHGTT